jgi:hypothetical protein
VGPLDSSGTSLYSYGHTHASSQQFYSQGMGDGVFYFNVSALGKGSPNQYTVGAMDCHGLSALTQAVGTWPVVLITAPMDRTLGGANPTPTRPPMAPPTRCGPSPQVGLVK